MSSTLVDDARDRAFENLYERYAREVYRYVLGVLRNPAEAEDVTQTTFLNAYRALQAGEQPQRPHNWLIAIAHNACRSRARWMMRRPREVPLELGAEVAAAEAETTNIRELTRALRRLPFNQRAAITMRELEGRSYPEIADSLDVTVPAVEALIARARRTLRLQAAALRGLVGVQLPRSLRKLFEHGDTAAGGMFGAGVAAKAAAVLFAGAVAGGLGYAGAEALAPAGGPAAPRLEPSGQAVVPTAAASVGAAGRTPAPAGPAAPTLSAPAVATAAPDATPGSGAAAPGAPTAQPAASPREQASGPAVQTSASVATAAALTTAATIAASTPVTTAVATIGLTVTAPVELPPPPEAPAPPQVPAPPLPPLPPLP
jgi:RNA polymerase sigma factor (sigma-70 family)